MNFDFNEMDFVEVPHFKGGEGTLLLKIKDDGSVKIINLVINKGCSVGSHVHTDSSETVYILSGEATVHYEGETTTLAAGKVHYCPKGKGHSIENLQDEPLVLFAVVPNQN